MASRSIDRSCQAPSGSFWSRLRVSISLQVSCGNGRLAFRAVVKNGASLSSQRLAPVPPERLTTNLSAAASNAEVQDPHIKQGKCICLPSIKPAWIPKHPLQELKRHLQSHGDLLLQWEAAGEAVSDELLWRWLRSKRGVAQAEACLLDHAQWRIQLGKISEEDIKSELAAKKTFLQGCDYHGRPVVVVLAARHVIKQRNLDETKRLITYTLENAIACSDSSKNALGQILCLFDLSGLGIGNLDTKALQAVFEVLQQHFPESLSELWFLNAPFIFWGLWKVVSPFIQPKTKEKIKFLNGKQRERMLEDTMPYKVLPSCYGGKAELNPIEVAAKQLAPRSPYHASSQQRQESQKDNQNRLARLRRYFPKLEIEISGCWQCPTQRPSMNLPKKEGISNGSHSAKPCRLGGQGAIRSWHFVRDHNPVWAAKVFGDGFKRFGSAITRPNWQRGQPTLRRHASAVSVQVKNAWKNRPPMPRPSYRLNKGSIQQQAHMAYVDVALFYILAVALISLAVFYSKDAVSLFPLLSAKQSPFFTR